MKINYGIIFVLLFTASISHGWNDEVTHPTISEHAATLYFGSEYLNEDVNGKRIKYLIQEGSRLEDQGTRPLNHFHDPTVDNLLAAGLDDILSGESALLWAQDRNTQSSKTGGDWSWNTVRDYWYKNVTALTDKDTDDNLEMLMRGLGYQMHLIQDMSQPNHVRNNAHLFDGKGWLIGFETWAKINDDKILNIINGAAIPAITVDLLSEYQADKSLSPMAVLFDTRTYLGITTPTTSLSQGLSEYTNGNFFSQDTVFSAERYADNTSHKYYFPYPRKQSSDIQAYIDRTKTAQGGIYISKTGEGETLTYLAREGMSTRWIQSVFGAGKWFYGSFKLDENCFQEYAQKLMPRAVAYSKALLDYFFRGEIELSLPNAGVYSKSPVDGSFTELRLNAKNVTATGEEMSDGSIELTITYNVAHSDPFQGAPVDVDPEYHHIIVPEQTGKRTIPRNTTTELVFDLSSSPLPIWATDVEIRVVYKGKLGNEEKSVAIGYKDISEPTPIDLFNDTDYTCINDQWFTAGDPAAITLADQFGNNNGYDDDIDSFRHNFNNLYVKISSIQNPVIVSSSNCTFMYAGPMPPGTLKRFGFILTDDSYRYSAIRDLNHIDPRDPYTGTGASTFVVTQTSVKNQIDSNGNYSYPQMYNMRGHMVWEGVVYDNRSANINFDCKWSQLP